MQKRRPPTLPARGFTLQELLLGLGVLSLLLIIAYPVLNHARDAGRMSRSTSNLRQISAGLHLYIAEHGGYFPESAMDAWVHGQKGRFWYNALGYYLDGEADLQTAGKRAQRPAWQTCPGRPFPEPKRYGGYGVSVGYGWNHQFFGYHGSEDGLHRYGWRSHISEVELPAQTIIVGTNLETDNAGNPIGAEDTKNICVYGSSPNSRRFKGAGLYLFVDGHIERLTPAEAALGGDGTLPERYLFKKRKNALYPEDKRPL